MQLPRYSRRTLLTLVPIAALTACGGSTPTAAPLPTPAATFTPRPISTIMVTVRTGSAVIPSPMGQSASTATPGLPATPVGTVVIAPTVSVPALRMGSVLAPLMGGTPFATQDGKAALRYPTDWDVQTDGNAAQFAPRNAMPTDANVPRVNFIGQPLQLDLLSGDNATAYTQTIALQTRDRGATDLAVRSVERVTLGGMTGPPALKIVIMYTGVVPVVSEQIVVQPPNGSNSTYFISATAPAGEYDAKWRDVIDGIAGSLIFH